MKTRQAKLISQPSGLYIISSERIAPGELMYDEAPEKGLEAIRECPGPYVHEGGGYYRIIATPEQIGCKYVQNKMDTYGQDDVYITSLTDDELHEIIDGGGDCEIYIKELTSNERIKIYIDLHPDWVMCPEKEFLDGHGIPEYLPTLTNDKKIIFKL